MQHVLFLNYLTLQQLSFFSALTLALHFSFYYLWCTYNILLNFFFYFLLMSIGHTFRLWCVSVFLTVFILRAHSLPLPIFLFLSVFLTSTDLLCSVANSTRAKCAVFCSAQSLSIFFIFSVPFWFCSIKEFTNNFFFFFSLSCVQYFFQV